MTKVWLNILREGNTALCGWSGLWLEVEIWCSSSALFVQLLTDDKATVLRNAYKETKIRKNEVNRPWRVHALDSNGKHSVIAARWDVTFYLFSSSEWVLPQLVASNRDSIHISLLERLAGQTSAVRGWTRGQTGESESERRRWIQKWKERREEGKCGKEEGGKRSGSTEQPFVL